MKNLVAESKKLYKDISKLINPILKKKTRKKRYMLVLPKYNIKSKVNILYDKISFSYNLVKQNQINNPVYKFNTKYIITY